MFDLTTKIEDMRKKAADRRVQNDILPDGHQQPDFFVANLVDFAIKDDQATMEAPIFSLSTREDLKVWTWTSSDGKKTVEVAPSAYGRATIHDKDVVIYMTSHLMAALNAGKTPSRKVRFTVYSFLIATNRNTWSDDYGRLRKTLDRLRGTSIKTDIRAGGHRVTDAFGLIDKWRIVEKSPDDSRMIAIEVTLSEWLYNAIMAKEVLTINRKYFGLRKPLERRLYEIGRKHVGQQGIWEISLEALRAKCGSTVKRLRRFRDEVELISKADTIPDFRLAISADGNKVKFYSRDARQVLRRFEKK